LPADSELGVLVFDQVAHITGVRAAETFFELFQLHLQLADLLEQLCFVGLAVAGVFVLLATGE